MSDWKLHTPTGVNDILPQECLKKRQIEQIISETFCSMGYQEVETPTFEFYDVFTGMGGQISQEAMFKFFDEQGRILTLRPDITTSIARMAATKELNPSLPLRYYYTGNVFRVEQTQGARQREFTQSGIELIGSATPMADAEVIAIAIESILAIGIQDFQIEIGQVAFFNGLVEQAGLNADDIERLRERIDSKDNLGITQLTENLNIEDSIKELMIELPYLFGGLEVLDKACVDGLNATSKYALDNIRKIYSILCEYGFESYISIDLGMLQSIDYYTGTIFKGFTHGVGFPICAGGRYDNLINKFGKNLPAIGVAFGINRLLSALANTEELNDMQSSAVVIFAEDNAYAMAYELSYILRSDNCITEIYINDDNYNNAQAYAKGSQKECIMRVYPDGIIQIDTLDKKNVVQIHIDDLLYSCEDDDCDCESHHHH